VSPARTAGRSSSTAESADQRQATHLVSLAISLILAVVTEMQASLPGIGRDIFMAQRSFRSADLYAGLILLGIIGFSVNYALLTVERRMLRWRNPNG
jgi:ABC-type nitrate/sulfonate/bicarbonate transport system permease component